LHKKLIRGKINSHASKVGGSMSVLAKLHLGTGDWVWSVSPESSSPDIEIGFTDYSTPVVFSDLSFGLRVTANGEEVFQASYPPSGVKYVSTDQQYISNDRILINADELITVFVWAKNAGVVYEGSESFVAPRPPQPYPSWEWNGQYWDAPVPYPNDGEDENEYVWDEDAQSWVVFE
jgi:hypothetical protein